MYRVPARGPNSIAQVQIRTYNTLTRGQSLCEGAGYEISSSISSPAVVLASIYTHFPTPPSGLSATFLANAGQHPRRQSPRPNTPGRSLFLTIWLRSHLAVKLLPPLRSPRDPQRAEARRSLHLPQTRHTHSLRTFTLTPPLRTASRRGTPTPPPKPSYPPPRALCPASPPRRRRR